MSEYINLYLALIEYHTPARSLSLEYSVVVEVLPPPPSSLPRHLTASCKLLGSSCKPPLRTLLLSMVPSSPPLPHTSLTASRASLVGVLWSARITWFQGSLNKGPKDHELPPHLYRLERPRLRCSTSSQWSSRSGLDKASLLQLYGPKL